ncbi:MAG: CTLH/CRA C-terminal to lish motif domain-containing protein [Monoraphidium minutum]|nr:MAG: CTLH/CRA C-terminal to lish motif domain-containing protein [Monoraphidium minutum]
MAEQIEAALLRVPQEALKRAAKDRKGLIDEASEALAALGPLSDSSSHEDQLAGLDQLAARLQGLKRKLAAAGRAEADEAARCRARLGHLAVLGAPARGATVAWNRPRLDRILVDHLLRSGAHESAAALASAAGITPLCDLPVFDGARAAAAALRRRDAGPALAWCGEQRARLKKARSALEFKLRLQEFIELLRKEQRLDAIAYARRHLAPWAPQHMAELQRALGALAFGPRPRCGRYQSLFEDGAWERLVELYHRELYRLASLPPESLLTVHMQAGLTALNNPAAYREGGSKEDPLHLPAFRALAKGLPHAKHVHSTLVCAVTREVMSDANPPMVLPNGYVYSRKAVEQLAAAHGAGRLACPKTGAIFGVDEVRRAYVV